MVDETGDVKGRAMAAFASLDVGDTWQEANLTEVAHWLRSSNKLLGLTIDKHAFRMFSLFATEPPAVLTDYCS